MIDPMHTLPHPDGVAVIDTHHMGRPHVVATYALLGDEPALVDPGPASTLPAVEAGLADHGLALGDIRHIVLTHIHLDHAGASGLILARSPRAHVYVHERGAPHLVDPSRLVSSAAQLWGDQLETLWGRTVPVDPAAITTFVGGETLPLGRHTLRAYDAPGHAKHHLVWHDESSGGVFVGDNCGVRLPGVAFTRPATPPPDVDLGAWLRTLDLIESLRPRWLLLTHFGAFDDPAFHLADFRERLLRWAELVRSGLAAGRSDEEQIAALNRLGLAEAAGLAAPEQAALSQQSGDLALSWRGLARYWQKRDLAPLG
jgi:glyoxylase-like metal-dependent hydrolase (beta-lactamase superfamily II)